MNNTFIEALLFGVVTIILGLVTASIFSSLKPELPKDCDRWNENHLMEINLLVIGFALRYLLELTIVRRYLLSN
jgi:hypothetical protein